MQGKGVVKLLAVLLVIAGIYQLSFSFVTRKVEKAAVEYAAAFDESERASKEAYYLDSIQNQPVYSFLGMVDFSYKQCKEKEVNLGLDLKGGMNVMMEVSVPDIIEVLSGHSTDPVFVQAIQMANEQHLNSQRDYVDLFGDAFQQLDPNAKLAPIFLF